MTVGDLMAVLRRYPASLGVGIDVDGRGPICIVGVGAMDYPDDSSRQCVAIRPAGTWELASPG